LPGKCRIIISMKRLTIFTLVLLVTCLEGRAWGQAYRPSIDVQIPTTPAIMEVDGKKTVYYELHITNYAPDTILLHSLDIIDTKDTTHYLSLEGASLVQRVALIGGKGPKMPEASLAPGRQAIVYIELSDVKATTVVHRIRYAFSGEAPREVLACPTELKEQDPLILGRPLKSGPWCAVYNPAWETGHRRKIFTWNGAAHIPGRYAIDFIQLNNAGQYARGNEDSIAQWYGYGADVLAVADGTIASAKDGFPECKTMSTHPRYPSDSATGNFISLQIGPHRYVFYEHLKPGSIRVKAGQAVKKGEVIASLGYTGQTTGPHLHIHVADNNAPLGAEGIPFAFESFTVLGYYKDFEEDFGKRPWSTTQGGIQIRKEQRPGSNEVIDFH
jgi:murein DD-endopeptidase